MEKLQNIQTQKMWVYFLLGAIVTLSLLLRGMNMFGYPSYREDEGTYVSQAWSVLAEGQLAPYTYWYDHAPLGWLLMAIWHAMVGFYPFGVSVNSGRVFMLLLNVATTVIVFLIGRRMSGRNDVGLIASLLFTLSPISIEDQRRVLLDNIMMFWLMVSVFFIVRRPLHLNDVVLSAIAFAFSVLSKESSIFFFPVMAVAAFVFANQSNRRFAGVLWFTVTVLLISFYPLFALLKGELMPTGWFLGGDHPHVSLYEAFQFQTGRTGGSLFDPNSQFRQILSERWLQNDPLTLIYGSIAVIANLLFFRRRESLFLVFMCIAYVLYLVRGGVVLDWYVIPLVPFFALNIALLYGEYAKAYSQQTFFYGFMRALPLLVLVFLVNQLIERNHIFAAPQTINQVTAIEWIRKNVSNDAVILMDNYAYLDLNTPPNGEKPYPYAHYYWKANQDPEIRSGLLHDDWKNVDYLLLTPAMWETVNQDNLTFVQEIFNRSKTSQSFAIGSRYEEPYGVVIREVNNQRSFLKFTWGWYKDRFITDEGQVVDLSNDNRTTSEGQSYAMLRAVWMNDRETFDRVWAWTKQQLSRPNDSLFAWLYENTGQNVTTVRDYGTATDADQDIAVALMFASATWYNDTYREEALRIITDIWNYETAIVKGKRYVMAGDWSLTDNVEDYTTNPSYITPYAYRLFAEVDQAHDWQSVLDSSYELLDRCTKAPLNVTSPAYIPPNWCNITPAGEIVSAVNVADVHSYYSYDALRTPWRIALDYVWYNDRRSLEYLLKMNHWQQEWTTHNIIRAEYGHDGIELKPTESLANYAALLGHFKMVDNEIGEQIFTQKVIATYNQQNKEFYWGDPDNYYDQNWAWFGSALFTDNLPNLWKDLQNN